MKLHDILNRSEAHIKSQLPAQTAIKKILESRQHNNNNDI